MFWNKFKIILKYLLIYLTVYTLYVVTVLFVFKFINPPTTAFIQQSNLNGILEVFQTEQNVQKWVPINSISNNIIFAVLASEDQRYFEHFGVDYVELEKVIHENIYKGQSRGASTITQQVAKNLFLFPQKLAVRKVFEIYYAYLIDFIWGKKRVLEVYLNIIQFGKKIYGVEAASLHYFNKDAKNVNINEASQIVAILPNPTRFNLKNKSKYLEKRISRIEKYSTKMNKQKIKELLDNY